MTPEIHNREARIAARRAEGLDRATRILQAIVGASIDPYEGYRQVYGIYVDSSGLLDELKPFFRVPGIEPDGHLRVDDEFRAMVRNMADEWLAKRGASPVRK